MRWGMRFPKEMTGKTHPGVETGGAALRRGLAVLRKRIGSCQVEEVRGVVDGMSVGESSAEVQTGVPLLATNRGLERVVGRAGGGLEIGLSDRYGAQDLQIDRLQGLHR